MPFSAVTLLASLLLRAVFVQSRYVFAHYMVGTITEAHAHQDIDQAIAMGLDAFALNIGDATQPFVRTALSSLFGYAAYRKFKLFVSMDVYASGAACYAGSACCNGPFDYQWIWDAYKGSPAYFLGLNGLPLITTFSASDGTNVTWTKWKSGLANNMYFIPDFDATQGYYNASPYWWDYWGPIVDGVFSWESAWPMRAGFGGAYPGDVGPDVTVIKGAKARKKGYMMGLSSVQYKDAYGTNLYRQGELNLPIRMANILSMNPLPDYIQVQTWNDGPESHYIGNLWFEQNNDTQPYAYANQLDWSHAGWQSLITSFITAFKNGQGASQMVPPSGSTAIGAAWYKTILTQSIFCAMEGSLEGSKGSPGYYDKPDGFDVGGNYLYWSVVLSPGAGSGYNLRTFSGGVVVDTRPLSTGLNYGRTATPLSPGDQRIVLLDSNGNTVMAAAGGLCVSAGCPDGIYNSNYQVLPLVTGSGSSVSCTNNRHDESGQLYTPNPGGPGNGGGGSGAVLGSLGGNKIITIVVTGGDGKATSVVETLAPFTTTDAHGNAVTEYSIKGLSTTGTALPPSQTVTVTLVDANGHKTTIREVLAPMSTTDAKGNPVTLFYVQDASTIAIDGKPPSSTGADNGMGGTDIITATITKEPPGFSTIVVTNPGLSQNTWTTTTDSRGSTTALPILLVKPSVGIVIVNEPPQVNILFQFPRIPDFYLPCIPIPFIKSCSSPPHTDGKTSNEVEPDLSSTKTCATSKTASDCDVTCSPTTVKSTSTVSCETACSNTFTACSASGLTTRTTVSAGAPICTFAPDDGSGGDGFDGTEWTSWLPAGLITIYNSMEAAQHSSTSSSTRSTSTHSPAPPSKTPITSNGDIMAVNVYSDSSCKTFVAGYRGQDILNNCFAFPNAGAVHSYQFVSGCTNGDTTLCNLFSSQYCSIDGGDSVGSGCGTVRSCQQTSPGPAYGIQGYA